MARIQAILIALITAVRRDFKTVGSFSGNNLFVVGAAFLFPARVETEADSGAIGHCQLLCTVGFRVKRSASCLSLSSL